MNDLKLARELVEIASSIKTADLGLDRLIQSAMVDMESAKGKLDIVVEKMKEQHNLGLAPFIRATERESNRLSDIPLGLAAVVRAVKALNDK